MMTLASEAEKMDDKEKKVATLVAKEEKDQLIPDIASDLVFLDNPALLSGMVPRLKPAGFLLVHSKEPVPESVEEMAVVSKKTLDDKTVTLLRKVKLKCFICILV